MRTVKNNRIRHLATAGLLSISSLAAAEHQISPGGTYYTYADVVAVAPSYRTLLVSEPVEHCYEVPPGAYGNRYEVDRHNDRGHPAVTILGGILGGLIGNQFGGGNGRRALTVAGTAIGATVASHAARQRQPHRYDYDYRAPARRCTTTTETHERQVLEGYDVTYLYHGQTFTRQVTEHPGDRIRIRVDVEPVG